MKKIKDFFRFNEFRKTKIIIVVVLALEILAGGYLLTYAQQFIDSFLDTSRVANTWNVEVDTANGEVKLAQRSCDNSVWFCDLTWRCAGTAGDGGQLLVKRTEEGGKQWKIWNDACNTPECGIDGAQTGDNLSVDNTIDFSAFYPARQTCKDAGGRLPTIAELQCIFSYKTLFGNNFVSNQPYLTSEESSNSMYVKNVNSYWNTVGDSNKSTSTYVRCVRGW
ncbi:MAG: hypothetical protein ACWGHO_04180 [Candidatus Moraniibacteriota bacterium]